MIIIPDVNGKINKWREFKLQNIKVLKHFRVAALAYPALRGRYERMSNCGRTVQYNVDNEGKYHYVGAWLCRDRLCPICAWRLSVKRTGEMIKVLDRLYTEYPNTHAIHVVLTVRNCAETELKSTIRQITQGFTRLKKRVLWNDYIMGYARSVEITYNKDEQTYHPHIHVVAIVPNRYTRQISIGDWVDMWRDCARVDYNPIVWANNAYNNNTELDFKFEYDTRKTDTEAAKQAIIEACKYAVKPSDIHDIATAGDIATVAQALAGARMVSYGGIIKRIRRELAMVDEDKPQEQIPPLTIDPQQGNNAYAVMYEWCSRTRNYIAVTQSANQNVIERVF